MTHEDVQADTGIPKSPNAEELDPFRAWTFRSWSGRCGGRGHS